MSVIMRFLLAALVAVTVWWVPVPVSAHVPADEALNGGFDIGLPLDRSAAAWVVSVSPTTDPAACRIFWYAVAEAYIVCEDGVKVS